MTNSCVSFPVTIFAAIGSVSAVNGCYCSKNLNALHPHTEDSDVENCGDFSAPPLLETPVSDSTAQENPTQLNKEIPNKEKQNTDLILSDTDAVREQVQENIELDLLCRNMPEAAPVLEEISELIVEAVQNQNSTQRLGVNIFPADLVRSRLMQLTSEHIRYVLESLQTHSTCIRNPKKYLLAMLFNAPVTMNWQTMSTCSIRFQAS